MKIKQLIFLFIIFTVPYEILARGDAAMRAYRKALKDGETSDRRVPVMIVGQDRSGKTSLKKSLKGEIFNLEEDSTNGIVIDPLLCEFTTEGWRPTSLDEKEQSYEQRAAKVTLKNMKLEEQSRKEAMKMRKSEAATAHTAQKQKERGFQKETEPKLEKGVRLEQASVVPQSAKEIKKVPLTVSAVPQRVQQSEMETQKRIKESKKPVKSTYRPPEDKGSKQKEESAVLNEVKTLYNAKEEDKGDDEALELVLWDFAGQSLFYTTHVLFMSRIAMYILTHNLSNKLEAKAVSQVKCGVHNRIVDTECDTTNLDFIHYWLSSIHALNHENESKDLPANLPVVFLVCTHADKPASGTQPEEVGKSILSNLDDSYKKHLVKHTFKVDNTRSGSGQSEDEEVKRLKEEIVKVAKQLPHLKAKIPLR